MRTMRTLKAVGAALALAVLALAIAGPATAKDRNNDGIPDRWERKHGLSLKKNQARRDQDKDGLRNRGEFRAKTDPRDADTDDDGTEDGEENAGTISSYDAETGVLVIDLFGGDTVTGVVDEATEIECDSRGDSEDDDSDGDPGEPVLRDSESDDDPSSSDDDNSGDGGDHGADDGDDSGHDGADDDRTCSVDDLVPGAPVHEAELEATADGLVYTEIELVGGTG